MCHDENVKDMIGSKKNIKEQIGHIAKRHFGIYAHFPIKYYNLK